MSTLMFGEETTKDESLSASGADVAATDSPTEPRQMNRATIALIAVAILGAGVLLFMHRKAGPSSIDATTTDAADAKQTVNNFLAGEGQANLRSMQNSLHNTERVVQQFKNYPSGTQVALGELRTNPFREHTVPDTTAIAAAGATQSNTTSEEELKRRRENARLQALKDAQNLQLQSIMYSDARKACMINNTLYREGQSIDNFVVEKISQSVVVVKNGPYRFELRMQR